MTTIETLTAAEASLTAARTALEEIERPKFAHSPELTQRRDAHFVAKRRVELLREQLDAEMKAQAVRDAAEKAARKDLDAGVKQLEASSRSVAEAVEQARAALEAVHRQAAAHTELVEHWRRQMAALGLKGDMHPDGTPQPTAAPVGAVVIDGRRWTSFHPNHVLVFAACRGLAADMTASNRLRDGLYGPRIAAELGMKS